MLTSAITAGFSALFFALLGTVLEMLASAGLNVAETILDSVVILLESSNLFDAIISLLPFSGLESLNFAGIIKGLAYGIVSFIFVVSLIKSITPGINDNNSDNPFQVTIRCAITYALLLGIFGTNFTQGSNSNFAYNGFISDIGKLFSQIIKYMPSWNASIDIGAGVSANTTLLSSITSPGLYVVGLIFFGTLLTGTIGAAINIIERMLTFALHIILGPLAVACFASKETAGTLKTWTQNVFAQFMALILSMFLWAAFKQEYLLFYTDPFHKLFEFAIALSLLSLIKNSEKIMQNFGIRLGMMNSAQSLVSGVMALGGAMGIASSIARSAGKITAEKINDSKSSPYNNSGVLKDIDAKSLADGTAEMTLNQDKANKIFRTNNSPYTATSSFNMASASNGTLGYSGTLTTSKGGMSKNYDVYVPSTNGYDAIPTGTRIDTVDGTSMYTTGERIDFANGEGGAYILSPLNPNDEDIKIGDFSESPSVELESGIKGYLGTIDVTRNGTTDQYGVVSVSNEYKDSVNAGTTFSYENESYQFTGKSWSDESNNYYQYTSAEKYIDVPLERQ